MARRRGTGKVENILEVTAMSCPPATRKQRLSFAVKDALRVILGLNVSDHCTPKLQGLLRGK